MKNKIKFAAQLSQSTIVVEAKTKKEAVAKIQAHAPEVKAADVYKF